MVIAFSLAIVAGVGQITFAQQAGGPPMPSADEMFRQFDVNQDDKLTLDEGGPGVRQFTKRLFDMTGKAAIDSISRDEFRRIVDQHRRQNGGVGRAGDAAQSPIVSRSARGNSRPSAATSDATLQQRLGGVWRGWVVDGHGENPNSGHMELELRIESNRIVGRELGMNQRAAGRPSPVAGGLGDGTFVIAGDEGKSDAGTLDATATSGQHAGREYPGIFRLEGTTLHWCVNNRNGDRPTDYETGRGNYYMILRKQP